MVRLGYDTLGGSKGGAELGKTSTCYGELPAPEVTPVTNGFDISGMGRILLDFEAKLVDVKLDDLPRLGCIHVVMQDVLYEFSRVHWKRSRIGKLQ